MRPFILLFVTSLLVQKDSLASANDYKALANTQSGGDQSGPKDLAASSPLIGALSRSNRKSRCVRCYDDRYDGYDSDAGSRSYGGYSYRRGLDDDRGSSYNNYPSYRGGSSDYDRYSGGGSSSGGGGGSYYRDRDDRYSPRSYYDEGRRYEGGRYYDRGGGSAADSRYYYDNNNYRDRYSGGADRFYDRSRQVYDRDYDRYAYPRYDYRNYRPFDETYRGQSGFDNSGRGYYFAGDQNNQHRSTATRCSTQVLNCPFQSTTSTQVTSGPIGHSDIPMQAHNNNKYNNDNNNNNSNNRGTNGWRHIKDNEQMDKPSKERDRDEQQSSSYGGRPPRPLGGSYLFDRDSNTAGGNAMVDTKSDTTNNNNSQQPPNAQAQVADVPQETPKPMDAVDNKKP